MLLLLTLANLRGLRETGTLMSIPVYLFLFTYIPMLLFGLVRLLQGGPVSLAVTAPPALQPLTLDPGPARLRRRLHRSDRHRSHQQRRAGLQAA